jgi:hypothetical protein
MIDEYKLLSDNRVFRKEDGAVIPLNVLPSEANYSDVQKFQDWLKKGNKPLPADPEILPSVAERREEEYRKQGINEHALIVALWEMIVENRPEVATALELMREKIKADIAK